MPTRIVAITVIIIGYNLSMDYVTYLKYHLCQRRATAGPNATHYYYRRRIRVFVYGA